MPPLTVSAWLADAAGRLRAHNPDAARDARLLLLSVLALPPAAILANPHRPLSAEELERLEELVAERLRGTPLQHLTGRAPFRNLELSVGPGVFVPRPETEGLVEHVLAFLRAGHAGEAPKILELCVGSGAIGLALVDEAPTSEVTAIERSDTAAACARANARRLLGPERAHRWTLLGGDLYEPLSGRRMPNSFEIVVANPPYIPDGMWGTLPREVRVHESPLALLGGPDGTEVIARIVAGAPAWIAPGGLLALEIDESHAERVIDLMQDGGFEDARVAEDLAGRPRYALAASRRR